MSETPIISLYQTLIVAMPSELSDQRLAALKERLACELERRADVQGLILEASGLDTVDSFIARIIRDLAIMARLMGVTTFVSGLDAATAIILVEMGLEMQGVSTALNLESALEQICPWIREAYLNRTVADDFELFEG